MQQVFRNVKYANGLVLLAKDETEPRGMIDRLIEIGRCCGMKMNMGRGEVMGISRLPSPIQIAISERTGECGIFHLFG